MNPLLQAVKISFSYHNRAILSNVSLDFRNGEVVSLLGPNGSGKTTLLKNLIGLLAPQQGQVLFEGRPLRDYPRGALAKRIAYVPQVHREAFAYTVEDVVLMGRMPYHGLFSNYSRRDREIAAAAMHRLNILHLKDQAYTEISGGERQLTLIARSIAQGAGVFIMDEPVNGLDYGNQMRLLADINRLAQDGLTFIMTTHFPDHALMTADRVVLLNHGRVVADGAPADVITRNSLRDLYRVEVDVATIPGANGNKRVCVPAVSGR
ncbi:MAG: ABC transporter ATP-binding protein [Desulfobulbus sp.]|jgi:iron complex transport system ATP-binding protein